LWHVQSKPRGKCNKFECKGGYRSVLEASESIVHNRLEAIGSWPSTSDKFHFRLPRPPSLHHTRQLITTFCSLRTYWHRRKVVGMPINYLAPMPYCRSQAVYLNQIMPMPFVKVRLDTSAAMMQANLTKLIKRPLALLPFQTTFFSKYSRPWPTCIRMLWLKLYYSTDPTSVHAMSFHVTRTRTLSW
jgi:hypothetical protein